MKIKEAEEYREKYKKMKKKERRTREQLMEKEKLLYNYKSLQKELKIMKDQWKVSEELRNEQKRQLRHVGEQLKVALKENSKLKKKFQKIN